MANIHHYYRSHHFCFRTVIRLSSYFNLLTGRAETSSEKDISNITLNSEIFTMQLTNFISLYGLEIYLFFISTALYFRIQKKNIILIYFCVYVMVSQTPRLARLLLFCRFIYIQRKRLF